MSRNTAAYALLISLPVMLASCGTPQERCISKHTREYRNVSKLLTEVEGNLSRGYAWEERQVVRERLTQCRDIWYDKEGKPQVRYRSCWRDYVDTESYRVPIDPASETRKRDGLRERKQALSSQAAAYTQACQKAFPDEES